MRQHAAALQWVQILYIQFPAVLYHVQVLKQNHSYDITRLLIVKIFRSKYRTVH